MNSRTRMTVAGLMLLAGQAASAQSEFAAQLSGAQEVPPVVTGAFGSAAFDVNISASVPGINFELVAFNLPSAFMAHIHCGPRGANGPIVVWLAGDLARTGGQDVNGKWVGDAKFTEANIIPGTGCGDTLAGLLAAMGAGRTYVNVHTVGNAGGEIRGQIGVVAPFTVP